MNLDEKQVEAVLRKAVDIYVSGMCDSFEPDAYQSPKDVIEDFNLAWQNLGPQEWSKLFSTTQISPEYRELLEWLDTKNKTEQDLFVWWANQDAESIRDMTTSEIVETLLEGLCYDRKRVMGYWDEADEDQKAFYKQSMETFWSQA